MEHTLERLQVTPETLVYVFTEPHLYDLLAALAAFVHSQPWLNRNEEPECACCLGEVRQHVNALGMSTSSFRHSILCPVQHATDLLYAWGAEVDYLQFEHCPVFAMPLRRLGKPSPPWHPSLAATARAARVTAPAQAAASAASAVAPEEPS